MTSFTCKFVLYTSRFLLSGRHVLLPSVVALVVPSGLVWSQSTSPAGPGAVEPGSIEVPLMTGNLGRSGEATNLQGGNVSRGLSAGGLEPVVAGTSGNAGVGALQGRMNLNQAGLVGSGAQSQNQLTNLGVLPPLAPTQFQKFVQDASGKNLPLHGYNLFDRGRFPSVNEAPVPANYVVGPGDELDIKVWGAVDIALRLPVDRQGQIVVPKVGPVTVSGIKASDLDAYLKKQIGKVYANFELSASLGKLRSIQIFVVGQARNPGSFTVSSLSTLVSAIFESGGPSATGSMRKIELVRSGKKVSSLDLYRFIQFGEASADTRLLPGDVIVIPPSGPRVALAGALDNPAIYELAAEQETVEQLLAYGGSSRTLTTTHKVLLERVDNQKAKGPREVQELALDAAGLKAAVRDGDVLTLLKIIPRFANAVTLRGNVAFPLRYALKPGMRVADLIPEVDALIVSDYYARKNFLVQYESGRGLSVERAVGEMRSDLPEINWDYASIERVSAGDVRTQLISFNLGKAVKDKDPHHNLLLQPGDVITIYSINDIPVALEKRSNFVKISGEVNAPGIYQVRPGETLPEVINRAGGLAASAYLYGAVFTRESTRLQQQANLDLAIRKAEVMVTSQAVGLGQTGTDTEKGQFASAQLAVQRMMLERLRTLKASGRIGLDLEPGGGELPPLVLEDGDSIYVPPRPGFVSVFGAVLAESTFIHKKGALVRDYLDRAGPMRDADIEAALLIRADGSVVANNAKVSWLGIGGGSFNSLPVYPGDSLFVPELVDKRTAYAQFIQGAKDWTQLLYQFGLGVAAIKTLKN